MSDLFETLEAEPKFEDLVGDGKKYRDPDAIVKKVLHADAHIERLEREQAELRAELQSRLTLDEMMNKLSQKVAGHESEELPENKNRQELGSPELDLTAEVQKLLKVEKEKDRRDQNIAKTRTELKNRFGADYNQKLKSIAEQLDVTPNFLSDMAATSPSGFLKLVDSVAKPDNNRPLTPPDTSVNPLGQPETGVKNAAYYAKIRKEDLGLYFSSKIQAEMEREARRQGPAFYQ